MFASNAPITLVLSLLCVSVRVVGSLKDIKAITHTLKSPTQMELIVTAVESKG